MSSSSSSRKSSGSAEFNVRSNFGLEQKTCSLGSSWRDSKEPVNMGCVNSAAIDTTLGHARDRTMQLRITPTACKLSMQIRKEKYT